MTCSEFLTTFTTLGAAEKFRIRTEQLNAQRQAHRDARANEAKKVLSLSSKVLYNVDFDFTDAERDSAVAKITVAAAKVKFC